MDAIPPIYWMIVIGFIAAFICFVLYELGMLLRESKYTVEESRNILTQAGETVEKANSMLSAIESPIKRLGAILGIVTSFVEGVTNRR